VARGAPHRLTPRRGGKAFHEPFNPEEITVVQVSRTFTVDKPAEFVVDYLADFGHAEAWDPGTQSCTRTDGSGPVTVGATWHNVSKVLGRETELTYRLEKLEPGHVVLVGRNDTATSTDDITVVAKGEATSEITYTADIELHGAAKLAAPVMKVEMERLGSKTEQQLKDVFATL
jgi:carbon monoxide dehydrogenase subunit G